MELTQWLEELARRLDVSEAVEVNDDTVRLLLDVARDAAHEVQRTAAPLTTFLLGVAVGRGASLQAAADAATAAVLEHKDSPAAD